jgi:ABC-2 type transport system permease protein
MMMRGLSGYLAFDLRSFWREPMSLIFTFVLPAVFFLAAASGSGAGWVSYTRTYSPSFVGLVIIIVALFTLGPSLVIGRELGFYKRLLATPLDTSVILVSAAIRAFIVVVGGIVEVLLLSYFVLGQPPSMNAPQFFLALVLGASSIFALGIVLGSVFKSTKTAFSVSVILLQPLIFFSGAVMPLSQLPANVQTGSLFSPTRHLVDLLRLGWNGELFTRGAILPVVVLFVFMVICGVAARSLFRWTSR